MTRLVLVGGLALLAAASGASAHPLEPSLLELHESASGRVDVLWKQPPGRPAGIALEPELPLSCRSVEDRSSERTVTSVTQRWQIDCGSRGLAGQRVGVRGLAESHTDALVRVTLRDGQTTEAALVGSRPSIEVGAHSSRSSIVAQYVALGAEHILTGFDHLFFVFGLLLLVRLELLPTIRTVTAFTVGHSLTLACAMLGIVRFSPRPIELAIALSVFLLAVEVSRRTSHATWMRRAPWLASGAFGLLHGLGFAGALAQVGLPATEIPLALFSFNAGIEVGQLAFVLCVALASRLLAHWRPSPRFEPIPLYVLGSLAAMWCFERAAALVR